MITFEGAGFPTMKVTPAYHISSNKHLSQVGQSMVSLTKSLGLAKSSSTQKNRKLIFFAEKN